MIGKEALRIYERSFDCVVCTEVHVCLHERTRFIRKKMNRSVEEYLKTFRNE